MVILLYAFMVIAGFEFGPVTATLAAVVIGVGVDYTIHVTHRFQEFLREGKSIDVAVTRTLQTTGSALLASAVTTSLGFAILTQSSLIPFQQLGWLTLVAIIGSALVSVLVLPSMLVIYARRSERSESEPEGERHPAHGWRQPVPGPTPLATSLPRPRPRVPPPAPGAVPCPVRGRSRW